MSRFGHLGVSAGDSRLAVRIDRSGAFGRGFAEIDFVMTTMWPNTALEPTAFTPFGSRFGLGFTDSFRGRGSAFGR